MKILIIITIIILGFVGMAFLGMKFINEVFEANGDYDGDCKR